MSMMSMKISKGLGSDTSGRREQPAGIVVLESLPQPPDPQLRAFVWCRCHPSRSALPAERARAPLSMLMVGLARNGGGRLVHQ